MASEKTENVAIIHKKGDVLLIDLWATWCPPCQAPMEHNQIMMNKFGKKWNEMGVRIIGISQDKEEKDLIKKVNDKKWTSIEHYKIKDPSSVKHLEVNGIPHILLVNRDGEVVFKGHPNLRQNLAADIMKLASGKLDLE